MTRYRLNDEAVQRSIEAARERNAIRRAQRKRWLAEEGVTLEKLTEYVLYEPHVHSRGIIALKERFDSIDDLMKWSPSQLMQLHGVGRRTLGTVIAMLEMKGLHLPDDPPPDPKRMGKFVEHQLVEIKAQLDRIEAYCKEKTND
jgi:hypothetical protein